MTIYLVYEIINGEDVVDKIFKDEKKAKDYVTSMESRRYYYVDRELEE